MYTWVAVVVMSSSQDLAAVSYSFLDYSHQQIAQKSMLLNSVQLQLLHVQ